MSQWVRGKLRSVRCTRHVRPLLRPTCSGSFLIHGPRFSFPGDFNIFPLFWRISQLFVYNFQTSWVKGFSGLKMTVARSVYLIISQQTEIHFPRVMNKNVTLLSVQRHYLNISNEELSPYVCRNNMPDWALTFLHPNSFLIDLHN